jgi:hypothetical protein
MKSRYFAALLIVAGSGCAAGPVPDDSKVAQSAPQALTLAECGQQQTQCFQNNPILGILTCPLQYAQCQATASNGIPAEVASAISDARSCASQQATCLRNAKSGAARLQCVQQEADCVAAIVNTRLPPVVTGTAQCVDNAVSCLRASETAQDVANCADVLQSCATDQAVMALPPDVGKAVGDISNCVSDLRMCTSDASSPGTLAQCAQDEAACVGTALGVPVPQGAQDAAKCADTAVDCTLNAKSASDVRACVTALQQCNANVAQTTRSCVEVWTQCLAKNPLGFLACAAELGDCT